MALIDSIKRFLVPVVDEDEDDIVETEERRPSNPPALREETAPARRPGRVVSINAGANGATRQIVVLKLEANTGAKAIIDHLKTNNPVVFSIARLDRNEAARAVDVIYGASYAVNGNMQKVSNDIFLVVPQGIEITGDITEEILSSADFSLDI